MRAQTHVKRSSLIRMSEKLKECKSVRKFSVYPEGISVYPEVNSVVQQFYRNTGKIAFEIQQNVLNTR